MVPFFAHRDLPRLHSGRALLALQSCPACVGHPRGRHCHAKDVLGAQSELVRWGCLVRFRHGFESCQRVVLSWDRQANPLTTENQSFVPVVRCHVADLGVMFEESSNGGNPSDGLCLSPF